MEAAGSNPLQQEPAAGDSKMTLRVLSLGAGVQSSVMALLAARGEIGPMPEAAIFADTGWEPKAVYEHLDWLEGELPFPVHRVSAGNIKDNLLSQQNSTGQKFDAVPFYLLMPDGSKGLGRRQCTKEYKIEPIHKKVRELVGLKPRHKAPKGTSVEQWIGISVDEMGRMKDSHIKWVTHRWPLIEIGWNRTECRSWFCRKYPGRTLPRSSCKGCPFRSDDEWAEMKQHAPEEFSEVVEVDKAIRNPISGIDGKQFMHRSLVPLDEVDFGNDDRQMDFGFLSECEGMCGV